MQTHEKKYHLTFIFRRISSLCFKSISLDMESLKTDQKCLFGQEEEEEEEGKQGDKFF